MIKMIRKRDGRVDEFNIDKIANAINKAFIATNSQYDLIMAKKLALDVYARLEEMQTSLPTVELVQDTVEEILIENGLARVAKAYIIYRLERTKKRDMNTRLMRKYHALYSDQSINHQPLNTVFVYGIEGASIYNEMFILNQKCAEARSNGEINIHHLEFYSTAPDSNHFDLTKLIDMGIFKDKQFAKISDYASLVFYCAKSIQYEQYGEIEFMNFDTLMARAIDASFRRDFKFYLISALELSTNMTDIPYFIDTIERLGMLPSLSELEISKDLLRFFHNYNVRNDDLIYKVINFAYNRATKKVQSDLLLGLQQLFQGIGMNSYLINAKVTICYGLDTSKEAKMFDREIFNLCKEYPQYLDYCNHIYLVKEGVNEEIFDIYKHAPKGYYFQFIDVNNRIYHASGASFAIDESGNVATTSINLAHLAYESRGDIKAFYHRLEEVMALVIEQLKEKYHLIKVRDEVRKKDDHELWSYELTKYQYTDLLKTGTLSIGFVGLKECKEYFHLDEAGKVEIIKFMRAHIPEDEKYHFNLATIYNVEIALELANLDREKFDDIPEHYSLGIGYERVTNLDDIEKAAYCYQFTEGGYKLGFVLNDCDTDALFEKLKECRIEFTHIL